MTLKQFWAEARRYKWQLNDAGRVRSVRRSKRSKNYCPIAAVARTWSPGEAAVKLRMRQAVVNKIVYAADFRDDAHRPWLLKQLGIHPQ